MERARERKRERRVTWRREGVEATVFALENKYSGTVWPGTLSSSKHPPFMNGGFKMKPGDTTTIAAPPEWLGHFWARARCSLDQSSKGKCNTGKCGGVLQCAGAGSAYRIDPELTDRFFGLL
ncbi:hypothetical protein LguiB_023944 [Lonicera macranthoides]